MTSPAPLPNLTPLQRYLRSQRQSELNLDLLLKDAAAQANSAITALAGKEGIGAEIRRNQYRVARGAVTDVHDELFRSIGKEMEAGIGEAAAAASQAAYDLESVMFRALGGAPPGFKEALAVQARSNLENVFSKAANGIPLSSQVYKTKALSEGLVTREINRSILLGESWKELGDRARKYIDPNVKGGVSYAAKRLGRTELNNAFHTTQIAAHQDEPWVTGFKWNLSGSHPRADRCNDYAEDEHVTGWDAGVFKKEEVPGKPHPQCSIKSTLVSGPSLDGVMSRRFVGKVIEIQTSLGHNLTVTPNHPVLTARGWVAAGKLNTSDYVICESGWLERNRTLETGSFAIPYNENAPTRIDQVVGSFRPAGGSASTTVPGSSEQFHGDGFDGEVNVVRTNSLLQHRVPVLEMLQEEVGLHAYAKLLALHRLRRLTLALERLWNTTSGFVGRFGTRGTNLYPVGAQELQYERATDADLFSQRVGGLSGPIAKDKIVGIRDYCYSGQVYNLQTEGEWYASNGIITHNCLCYVTATTVDEDEFIKQFTAGKYNQHIDEKIYHYAPRSARPC